MDVVTLNITEINYSQLVQYEVLEKLVKKMAWIYYQLLCRVSLIFNQIIFGEKKQEEITETFLLMNTVITRKTDVPRVQIVHLFNWETETKIAQYINTKQVPIILMCQDLMV